MAGTGVGKFSSTAGSNTANMTVNFAENMAPSNVNNAARELMGHIRDMYEQLGDGYFEYGDGDGTYTVARGDSDTFTITIASTDLTGVYFAGRKLRITDSAGAVTEGTIASSSYSSNVTTVNTTGAAIAGSGVPAKIEIGIDTAAFGGKVILDDDGDTYIEAPTDDQIDIYAGGTNIGIITATTVTFNDGVTVTTADNTNTLTLTSTDADSASGPVLRLFRDSASAADSDNLAFIKFDGKEESDGDEAGYVTIQGKIVDSAAGSPDGALNVELAINDSGKSALYLGPTTTVFNEDSADIDFRVESNGNANMLFVDGGNDAVNIGGTTVAGGKLNVETSDDADSIVMVCTSTNASEGPVLKFKRDNNSSADGDLTGSIKFQAENDANQQTVYYELQSSIGDDADGAEDGRLTFYGMVAGTARNILDMTDSNIVFNQDSLDLDFRIESDGNTHGFFLEGSTGNVSIGTSSIDVSTQAGGSGYQVLQIENAEGGQINLDHNDAGTGSTLGMINFNRAGEVLAEVEGVTDGATDSGRLAFRTQVASGDLTERMRITSDGKIATGAEAAPDSDPGGLCLDQNGEDLFILTLKSSDVAHGVTGDYETDTYGFLRKNVAATGALQMIGIGEVTRGLLLDGIRTTADTATNLNAIGTVATRSYVKNGTAQDSDTTADQNIFVVAGGSTANFIVKGDGDIYYNGADQGAFDNYDDAMLVRSLDLSHNKNVINSTFDKYVKYNHETLADAKLVGREDDGTPNHFINISGMQRLHNGAIWQQYEKTERLATAMYELAKAAVGEEKANEILKENKIKLLN